MKKIIISLFVILMVAFTLPCLHYYFHTNYVVLNKLNTPIILTHADEIIKQETETIDAINRKRNNIFEEFKDEIDKIIHDSAIEVRLKAYNLKLAIIENLSHQYYKNTFSKDFKKLPKIKVIQEAVIYQLYAFIVLIAFLFLYVFKNYFKKML
jgi:hypothetical protein